jgi:hypothetical protein
MKVLIALALAFGIAAAGCAALVVGAGAGAGAYTYVQGELVRSYRAPYAEVMSACTQLLKDLDMPVEGQQAEDIQTVISSRRKDGTPVVLKVRIVGLNVTELSVRTGTVGYWNRDFSRQFHEFVAERLGSGSA